jgi:hypothetical protein
MPPEYVKADVVALQALAHGTANADQQQRALNWMVNNAAATYEFTYRQNDRDHAFADGRRFVGQQIIKLLKLKVGMLDNNP